MKKVCLVLLLMVFIILFSNHTYTSAFTDTRKAYEKTGNVIWEVKTNEKIVAITFDDGPHPTFTPQLLDILAKYHAKATFFVSGNKVKRFPDVLKRQIEDGHEIANHTYNHIYNRNITSSTLELELMKTDTEIQRFTGKKTNLYRPVGGLYNDLIIDTAVKNGKKVILWSWQQDPKDWKSPSASTIYRNIIQGIRPGNIVLLHDWIGSEFSQTSQTVKALDEVMKYLYKNGYECVTVTELLNRAKE